MILEQGSPRPLHTQSPVSFKDALVCSLSLCLSVSICLCVCLSLPPSLLPLLHPYGHIQIQTHLHTYIYTNIYVCIRVKLAKDVKNAINELENKAEEKKKKQNRKTKKMENGGGEGSRKMRCWVEKRRHPRNNDSEKKEQREQKGRGHSSQFPRLKGHIKNPRTTVERINPWKYCCDVSDAPGKEKMLPASKEKGGKTLYQTSRLWKNFSVLETRWEWSKTFNVLGENLQTRILNPATPSS